MCMGDFIGVVVAACRGAIYRALIWAMRHCQTQMVCNIVAQIGRDKSHPYTRFYKRCYRQIVGAATSSAFTSIQNAGETARRSQRLHTPVQKTNATARRDLPPGQGGFLQLTHRNKHSISLRVVPAPSSVVPAKAGTQSCAGNDNKIVVFTDVFWAPAFAGATEREAGVAGKETL